jgi:hypothetical protein
MKSTRQKGNQFQDWCATWLREQGYNVRNQKTVAHRLKTGYWISLAADIFGCDIIAIKKTEQPLFIQVTLHGAVQKRLDELKKYSWPLNYVRVQVWMKKDKHIAIKEFDGKRLYDHAKIVRRKLVVKEEE